MNDSSDLVKLTPLMTRYQRIKGATSSRYFAFVDEAHLYIGPKYARIDVGTSGKYMVELSTENIFGIKAYGVIHRGHQYGTLDTINDWNWSEYVAFKKPLNP